MKPIYILSISIILPKEYNISNLENKELSFDEFYNMFHYCMMLNDRNKLEFIVNNYDGAQNLGESRYYFTLQSKTIENCNVDLRFFFI